MLGRQDGGNGSLHCYTPLTATGGSEGRAGVDGIHEKHEKPRERAMLERERETERVPGVYLLYSWRCLVPLGRGSFGVRAVCGTTNGSFAGMNGRGPPYKETELGVESSVVAFSVFTIFTNEDSPIRHGKGTNGDSLDRAYTCIRIPTNQKYRTGDCHEQAPAQVTSSGYRHTYASCIGRLEGFNTKFVG